MQILEGREGQLTLGRSTTYKSSAHFREQSITIEDVLGCSKTTDSLLRHPIEVIIKMTNNKVNKVVSGLLVIAMRSFLASIAVNILIPQGSILERSLITAILVIIPSIE